MTMSAEKAAETIRQAYDSCIAGRTYETEAAQLREIAETGTCRRRPAARWMMLSEIATATDLTAEQTLAGLLHLEATDPRVMIIPESNQKALTAEQRAAEVVIGRQRMHLIGWI